MVTIEIDEDWLRRKYVTEELTLREIAALVGCTHTTIIRHLAWAGIDRRPTTGTDRTKRKLSKTSAGHNNPMYGKKHDAITKAKMSKAQRARDWRPTPEHIDKLRAAVFARRGLPGTPLSMEARRKLSKMNSGPNHPQWKGGISFGPYCHKFNNALKEQIRDDFGRRCYLCGEPENGKRLAIHHTDYNKNTLCNGKTWGLIPLCASCHSKTNFNRWYWFALLNNYWIEKYIPGWIEL